MNIGSNYLTTGKDDSRHYGTGHPSIVPYQAFQCGDNKELMICIGSDQQFKTLCEAIKKSEFSTDEKYKTNSSRVKHRRELIAEIGDIFKSQGRDEWLRRFDGLHFPFGPVRSVEESFEDPQAQFREMTIETPHPTCGTVRMAGFPVKYSKTPLDVHLAPPLLGQHTIEILKNLLHLTDEQIQDYHNTNVVQSLQNDTCSSGDSSNSSSTENK